MRRLLLILPLLLIAADAPQEIEGWKVFNGKWEGNGKSLRSSVGTIIWQREAKRSIEFSCVLCVHNPGDWKYLAVFWGWDGAKEGIENRNQLYIRSTELILQDRKTGKSVTVPFDFPVGKPMVIKGKILPTSAVFMVGKNQLTSKDLSGLENFALHVNGPDVTFDNISIRAR
ncbi:MAG: hypothetical protein AB1696_28750 [Planctomycetota bacterium]